MKETVVESGPKPKTIAVGGDVQITSGGGSHVEVQTTSTSGAGVATHSFLILFDFFGLSSEDVIRLRSFRKLALLGLSLG